jgi:hypothetical protein
MVPPQAFLGWTDSAIRRGIPRLQTKRNENKIKVFADMAKPSRANNFVIAPARSFPKNSFIGGFSECRARRFSHREPVKPIKRGSTPQVGMHLGWHCPIYSRCRRQTHPLADKSL